jgi:hypothetical protein
MFLVAIDACWMRVLDLFDLFFYPSGLAQPDGGRCDHHDFGE